MNIHFVCTNNTFRSRMAEAYFNSLDIKNWKASSSGIEAGEDHEGSIAWDTKEILIKHNLIEFTSLSWIQTTKNLIEKSQRVIFMEDIHKKFCEEQLGCVLPKHEIWNIPDTDINKERTTVLLESEATFQIIKKLIDEMVLGL